MCCSGSPSARQVITITHLPQIAALADRHFRVEKVAGRSDAHAHRAARRRTSGKPSSSACSAARSSLPRYAASRVLLAPIDDVWAFLAEPYNLADWWPGVSGVEPDRRGLVAGRALDGASAPTAPATSASRWRPARCSCSAVVPGERIAFQLAGDRIDADLKLHAVDEARTEVSLVVDGPWLIGLRRVVPAAGAGAAARCCCARASSPERSDLSRC